MKERGMKKWLAYKSLSEQEKYLENMQREKSKIAKPLISENKAEEINSLLTSYHGEMVAIRFFHDGFIKESRGVITRIDTFYNFIKISDISISMSSIVDVYDC
jgi:hypothetical protein